MVMGRQTKPGRAIDPGRSFNEDKIVIYDVSRHTVSMVHLKRAALRDALLGTSQEVQIWEMVDSGPGVNPNKDFSSRIRP